MADISIIHEGNTDYNVKDAVGREALAVVENKGAKNLLKLGFTHKTAGNQTVDMTADGNGIIVNGDRNTTTDVILVGDLVTNQSTMVNTQYTLDAGKYVMISTGKNILRYQVYCHDGTNSQSLGYTTNEPLEFEYTTALKAQYPYIAYRLWASRVSSFDNFIAYPMVCSKEEWDISQAYVPYGKTNAELTNDTSTLFTENTRQETEIGVVANSGAKNLLYYNNLPNKNNGVTFTPSETTGIISISGTVTSGSTAATITPTDNLILPAGTYTFTCEDAKTVNTADAYVQKYQDGSPDPTVIARSYENNTFTLTEQSRLRVRCRVYAGKESGQTFSPMIRPAAITDPTFQPYAKTNRELTVITDEDRAALVEIVDNGAKNLLKNTLGSGTKSGLLYTTGTDGSIVITAGTPTANADFVIPFTPKESGQYVLQGCPSGGSGITFKGQITLYPSMTNVVEVFDDTSVTATLTGGTQYAYRFRVYSGKAIGDVTIYPMVCSEAAWKISQSYQPYSPSWQETYLSRGVQIQSGDLDDYKSTGRYYISQALHAAAITNSPTTTAGYTLTVEQGYQAPDGTIQTATVIDTDSSLIVYKRMYRQRSGVWGWSSWYKFEGTAMN